MGVLSGLEPKQVFRYFEELCAIPHGSHNTRAVSDYLKDFAEAHRLKFRRDELNNVIIWKAPTAGYEHSPAVMIQGHMDMVAEKDADCTKDMETEGASLTGRWSVCSPWMKRWACWAPGAWTPRTCRRSTC